MIILSIKKYKSPLMYGFSLAVLFLLLKWMEYRLILIDHAFEVYIGCLAILFTSLGVWLALQLLQPKVQTRIETIIVEKEVFIQPDFTNHDNFKINEHERVKLGLSNRELEVLQLMSEGLSNQEIAGRLFLSLNTIKTHTSKIFEKMDVKRRTQAIEMARKLQIIP